MYLDLNGSANSLTHDLPFTKGGARRGPALRGSGVGNRFEVVLVPSGVGGGQLLVDLFLLTASFLG